MGASGRPTRLEPLERQPREDDRVDPGPFYLEVRADDDA